MSAKNPFDASAPCALPIFYRTYSRLTDQGRENYQQVTDRTVAAIAELGHFTEEETALVREMQENRQVLPSGRWCGLVARNGCRSRRTSVVLTTAPAPV